MPRPITSNQLGYIGLKTYLVSSHIFTVESVKMLQIQFGTMDFSHLHDFCRWKFRSSMFNLCDAYAKSHFLIFNAKNVPYVSR